MINATDSLQQTLRLACTLTFGYFQNTEKHSRSSICGFWVCFFCLSVRSASSARNKVMLQRQHVNISQFKTDLNTYWGDRSLCCCGFAAMKPSHWVWQGYPSPDSLQHWRRKHNHLWLIGELYNTFCQSHTLTTGVVIKTLGYCEKELYQLYQHNYQVTLLQFKKFRLIHIWLLYLRHIQVSN